MAGIVRWRRLGMPKRTVEMIPVNALSETKLRILNEWFIDGG
jgi:hypothetical protein